MKTRFLPRECNNQDVAELVDSGYSREVAIALCNRGINTGNLEQYRDGKCIFHHPFDMPNMADAVETINLVIESGGSIMIYGDYDADGLSASCLLSLYFNSIGVDNDIVVPTRQIGYGINVDLIQQHFEEKWYDLILTVDCGISNKDEIAQLKELFDDAVDIVVTDHHELPQSLPDCICINPKMGYPFPYLSGSGVAYKLAQALSNDNCKHLLDLALIGTIADIMPMLDENRSIVKIGLENFSHKSLKKLAELSNVKKPYSLLDIAMRITPKINAAGRIGDLNVAIKLMMSIDKPDIASATKLVEFNDTRRQVNEDIAVLALCQCDNSKISRDRLVFVKGEDWAIGVLGIVANSLKEQFNCCALVMTREDDCYHGSARGVEGVDLFALFNSCSKYLVKYGGHKASVGFTVHESQVDSLYSALVESLSHIDKVDNYTRYYDLAIDGSVAIADLYKFEQSLQPLQTMDNFVYYVKDYVKYANVFGKNSDHLSFTLASGLEVKSFFKYSQLAPVLNSGADVELLCSLSVDSYSGNIFALLIDIVLCNSLHYEQLYSYNYLKNIDISGVVETTIDIEQAIARSKENSVLLIVDSFAQLESLQQIIDTSDFTLDYFYQTVSTNRSIVVSPLSSNIVDNYATTIVFDSHQYIKRQYYSQSVVHCLLQDSTMLESLQANRDKAVLVYKAMLAKTNFDTLTDCYKKYLSHKISNTEFALYIRVFEQLGIISLIDKYTVKINRESKVNLDDSYIYRQFANNC